MSTLIENIKQIKNYTDKHIKIPFPYILFIVDVFLLYNTRYIDLIGMANWLPNNIKNILLGVTNELYGKVFLIMSVLLIAVLILSLLASYTSVFRYILPKDVEYIDDTTVSWNEYSAIRKVSGIIIRLGTTWWIYYFSINIFLNQHFHVETFFISKDVGEQLDNILVNSSYISAKNLEFMNTLYYLNIVITIVWIVKALFEIRIPSDKYSIKFKDLSHYIEINSFKSTRNNNQIKILKTKYSKKEKYLIIEGDFESGSPFSNKNSDNIPMHKRAYKILNLSENLSDIIYHFESLQNGMVKE